MCALQIDVYDWESMTLRTTRAVGINPATHCGLAITGRRGERLRLIYDSGGAVYLVTSDNDGRTWSDVVSVGTGTYPVIAYSPEDDVEIIAYINPDGYVRVRRRLGETASLGAEAAVDDNVTAASIAIERLAGTRSGLWVIVIADTAQTVHRYRSVDNGRTWESVD